MRSFRSAVVAVVALALFSQPAVVALAQDEEAPATAPGKIGPGAPPAKPAKSAKAAPAASGIQLARRVPISPAVNVHENVLKQCEIETKLPQMLADRSHSVTLVDKPGAGSKLDLKIIDIHAPDGGIFSGPKWITVEGHLTSGKVVKGDFVAKETSMASAGACGMLHKVMLALAGEIATWLENPTKGAKLGNAH